MVEVYLKSNTNYSNNGDMTLLPTNLTGTQELNGVCEIKLEHDYDNDGRWEYLSCDNIIACKTPWSDKQLFRIYNVVKDIDTITAYARHIVFDLANYVLLDVRPTLKNGQDTLNNIFANTPFTGHSDITTINTSYYVRKNIMESLAGDDDNSFIKKWGGERYYDNFNITINSKLGEDRGVRAEFGYNLNGIEENINYTDVVTRIIPVGYNGIMLDGDTPWVDSSYINNYANIRTRVIEFNDIKVKESPSEIDGYDTLAEAQAAMIAKCTTLYAGGLDKPTVNYKIDMITLAETTEYKGYEVLEDVHLGDTITCKHEDIDIDIKARCIKLEWETDDDIIRYTNIELGNFIDTYFNDLTDVNTKVNNILNKNGTVNPLSIEGTIDAMKTKFKALKDISQTQHIRAMLFEDLDSTSPTFGAMCIGTMGFEIASERTSDGTDWNWRTFGTGKGFVADMITTGILKSVLIQNLDGSFQLDLSGTGGCNFYNNGKKAIGISGNTITLFDTLQHNSPIGFVGTSHFTNTQIPLTQYYHRPNAASGIGYVDANNNAATYMVFDKYAKRLPNPITVTEQIAFYAPIMMYNNIFMNNYKIYLNADKTKYIWVMADGSMRVEGDITVHGNVKYTGSLQQVTITG